VAEVSISTIRIEIKVIGWELAQNKIVIVRISFISKNSIKNI